MFDECRFSVKCKEAFKTFINRNLANIGNKICWHSKIYLTFPLVEFRTFKQMHKNVVLLVFDAYKSLNYDRIVNRRQLINFFGLVFKFFKPIKLPICFLYSFVIGICKTNYFCIKNLTCQRNFNRICQLVDNKNEVLIKYRLKFCCCWCLFSIQVLKLIREPLLCLMTNNRSYAR